MEDDAEEYEGSMHLPQKRREVESHAGINTQQALMSPAPEAAGEDTCTIGILLPDGRRLQRLFYKHDKVEVSIFQLLSVYTIHMLF